MRARRHLQRAFRLRSEYFRDVEVDGDGGDEIDFKDHGLQLTRSFRAFKLWMSLQVHGLGAFRAAIDRGIALAELAEAEVRRRPGWRIVTPAQLAVVTFRYVPAGAPDAVVDAINRELAGELAESGYAAVNTTTLAGRVVLRMCTINPRTTEEDVRGTLEVLDALARRVAATPARAVRRERERCR